MRRRVREVKRCPAGADAPTVEWPDRRPGVPVRRGVVSPGRQSLLAVGAVLLIGLGWALASPAAGASAEAGVSLFDDDGGQAMFTSADLLAPGNPVAECISVGASSAGAGDTVRFIATDVTGDLADYLTVTLESGSGGSFGDCAGFTGSTVWTGTLTELGQAGDGDGLDTGWEPDTDPTRSFRVTVEVDADLQVQGLSATGGLSWRLFPGPGTTDPTPTDSGTTDPTPTDSGTTDPTPTDSGTADETPTDGATTDPGTDTTTTDATTDAATTGSTPTDAAAAPTSATPTSGTPSRHSPKPSRTDASSGPPGGTGTAPPGGGSGGGAEPDLRLGGGALATIEEVARRATATVAAIVGEPQYPLAAITVALLFLAVQDLIDRRDPKLAAAAMTRRDADVIFPDLLVPNPGVRL